MKCVWVKPTFEPQVLIIISLLVTLMSAPIFAVLSFIINCYVLAPTAKELEESNRELQLARESALSVLHHDQAPDNVVGKGR